MGRVIVSAREVEDMAAAGQTELVIGKDAIVTPLARDRARELGLALRGEDTGDFCSCRMSAAGMVRGGGPERVSAGWGDPALPLRRKVSLVVQRLLLDQWREAFSPRMVDLVAGRVISLLQEKCNSEDG